MGQTATNNASINGVTPTYLPLFMPRLVAGRISPWTLSLVMQRLRLSVEIWLKNWEAPAFWAAGSHSLNPRRRDTARIQIIGIAPAIAAISVRIVPTLCGCRSRKRVHR